MRYGFYRNKISENSIEVDGVEYYIADAVDEVLSEIESELNTVKDKVESITDGLY